MQPRAHALGKIEKLEPQRDERKSARSSFALSGLPTNWIYPGLAPWAALFRRFAAGNLFGEVED
jgi:hypothetical protein